MKKLNGFSIGFSCFFKAIPFIFKNKLWWTFAIPLLLNIMLYIAGFSLIDYLGDLADNQIDEWLTITSDSKVMQALPGILGGIAKVLLQIVFFFVFAYFSGYVLLIILSPLFAWLSEKTDNIINNNDYPFNFSQLIKDIWRGILIAFRNLFYEIGITILIIIATFIPVIGQILSPVSFIFYFIASSYFYGFSFMDYTNERKRINVSDSVILIRKHRGMAIANGSLFSLSLLIPFCGVMLAGFTAIIASVGATMAMNAIPEIKEREIISKKQITNENSNNNK